MTEKKEFLKKSGDIAFDEAHRATIKFNISKYDAAVAAGEKRYADLEKARDIASAIKEEAILNLDKYLLQFEEKITSNGAKVLWASDSDEAIENIVNILKAHETELVVKSKSMITEEIEFNHHVEKNGVESVETDLGEYIVQVAGEKPYHIVTPAMHKSRHDIADLFHEKFNTPKDSTPEFLTNYVRGQLRKKFTSAQVGVTGANFIVADAGGIALTENEGNGMMSFSFPKVHIVIAGIEKVVPHYRDLGLIWPLLAAHGTGQQITVYNSLITGPRKANEVDGPEKMYVILLDNGRTEVLKQETQFEALKCIRCGACLNACPVYKTIGGYTYDSTYSGPIGSVLTPFFKGFKGYGHLSYACSVCGKCTTKCPVRVPLHDLLLENRRKSVEEGNDPVSWNLGMKGFEFIFGRRKLLDLVNGNIKNIAVKLMMPNALGEKKKLRDIPKNSFSKQWKKTKK